MDRSKDRRIRKDKEMAKVEQSIIEMLPQIPYVVDQVGSALDWAKAEVSEGEYNKITKIAYDVAKYAKEVSNPNFYKTHLVIASILSHFEGALESKRFAMFDTASKSVEKALKSLNVAEESVKEHGCFKAVLLRLVPLAKESEDLFVVALIGIKHDLEEIVKGMEKANIKTPVTSEDYITILGYSFVMANIRMARLDMLNKTHEIYNNIEILLNSINY